MGKAEHPKSCGIGRASSRLWVCLLLFLLPMLNIPLAAFAQPTTVSRTLRLVDFEERKLGNVEDLPMHWLKVEGKGLPHYISGRLTTDRARSARHSFRFDLNGGSLIYRYDPRQIPVQIGAHYRVRAYVQTTALPHARARMTAYFTDIDRRPLESTIVHSELYAEPAAQQDQWHELSIHLSADDPAAAYLCVELELLQPSYYQRPTLGDRTLFPEDIHGTAWFDDVSVAQVPHVELFTRAAGNIFRGNTPLGLVVRVNDRFTDDLSAQLRVSDAAGNEVYQRSGALDMRGVQTVGPGTRQVDMSLPDLPPGWYCASLSIQSRGQQLGDKRLEFVRLADSQVVRPDGRFGIIATNLSPHGWPTLPRILPYLAAGRVKLTLWGPDVDIQNVDSGAFDTLLEQLASLGITPTGCLISPPPEVAGQIGGSDWHNLLTAPRAQWQPRLAYLIARNANHLDRWQLGADGTREFVADPAMRRVYDMVYEQFAKLVAHPNLAMPWPAWYEVRNTQPVGALALSVPTFILPEQLPLYVRDSDSSVAPSSDPAANIESGMSYSRSSVSLSLEPLDAGKYGRQIRIRDFVERIVYALSAGAGRIDMPLPLTVQKQDKQLIWRPDELFVVLHTVLSTLSGATYQGKVPIAPGVDAFLFDRSGKGILILWDTSSASQLKRLPLRLGDRPVRLDMWGNATPLLSAATQDAGSAGDDSLMVDIGPLPVFLLDIDGKLAQLRASVSVDRPLLESSFEPHKRRLRFTNPYPQAISGTVKLVAPAGWNINPPTSVFNLNPGETFDRELTIEFPYNSFAGTKIIEAHFTVQADHPSSFTVPIALRLGLSDVGMRSLALRDGQDIIVQQMISNYGDKPINYSAFAIVPGQARQERLVTDLAPGKTVIKRYRFSNVTIPPSAHVRVGIKQISGTRILNEDLELQ